MTSAERAVLFVAFGTLSCAGPEHAPPAVAVAAAPAPQGGPQRAPLPTHGPEGRRCAGYEVLGAQSSQRGESIAVSVRRGLLHRSFEGRCLDVRSEKAQTVTFTYVAAGEGFAPDEATFPMLEGIALPSSKALGAEEVEPRARRDVPP